MTLKEYLSSCWPKYNPYHGQGKEILHLDYLNCIWGEGNYQTLKKKLGGVPLGKLRINSILF